VFYQPDSFEALIPIFKGEQNKNIDGEMKKLKNMLSYLYVLY